MSHQDSKKSNNQAGGNPASSSTPHGTGPGKKKHPAHKRSNDIQSLTNGIERLQLGPKKPAPHLNNEMKSHYHPHQHQQSNNAQQSNPKSPKVKVNKTKTSNDFLHSGLYAGAGFDRSPEASSLPLPKFLSKPNAKPMEPASPLAQPSGTNVSINVEDLFRSAAALTTYPEPVLRLPSPKSKFDQAGMSSTESLRRKSETLMKILEITQPRQTATSPAVPVETTKDLEEMTAQVRKLLNLG